MSSLIWTKEFSILKFVLCAAYAVYIPELVAIGSIYTELPVLMVIWARRKLCFVYNGFFVFLLAAWFINYFAGSILVKILYLYSMLKTKFKLQIHIIIF
jgi:hypothetical protein